LYGPTCDGSDVLPEPFELPEDISSSDYIEFQRVGAYSLAGRTRFNGFYSENVVRIEGTEPAEAG
jgi:ornithine decarboxylase